MEKREQAVGSSDPEDEDVETDEVKAKQLADQEVKTFLLSSVKKLARFQNDYHFVLKFLFKSQQRPKHFECENVAKIVGFLTPCQF